MAIREQDNYGKPISEKLSKYLKKHTTNEDRANVSISTGVGTSTIRDVVYRNNSLTEKNSVAIEELMRFAIKNCMRSTKDNEEALEYLVNELPVEAEEVK